MTTDSRVRKLTSEMYGDHVPDHYEVATKNMTDLVARFEHAGLIVSDPDDTATLTRVARALWDGHAQHLPMASAVRVFKALAP